MIYGTLSLANKEVLSIEYTMDKTSWTPRNEVIRYLFVCTKITRAKQGLILLNWNIACTKINDRQILIGGQSRGK